MTPPKPQPRPLLFLFGCALVFFLVLLVFVGVVMFWRLRGEQRQQRQPAGSLQAEWRARLREEARIPDEAWRLAPARTDSGNAAALLYGPRAAGRGGTLTRIVRQRPLSPDDSAVVAAAATDTALDHAFRAARMLSYSVAPLLLADTARASMVVRARIPDLFPNRAMSSALEGLILRGYERARRGRGAAAREDVRAAIGLGLMMYEREPTSWGAVRGLRTVINGTTLLSRWAGRDTALAGPATRVGAWAERRFGALLNASRGLSSNLDSALVAVVDTSLPFGVRAEQLYYGSIGAAIANPWRAAVGPGGAVWRRVRAYEQHPDPDLAAVAVAADTALTRIKQVGWRRRLRWMFRGQ